MPDLFGLACATMMSLVGCLLRAIEEQGVVVSYYDVCLMALLLEIATFY
jgi:hypothetical protein